MGNSNPNPDKGYNTLNWDLHLGAAEVALRERRRSQSGKMIRSRFNRR